MQENCGKFHKLVQVGDELICYGCRNIEIRESKKPKKVVRVPKPPAEPKPTFTTLRDFSIRFGGDELPCLKIELEAARELCQIAYQATGAEDISGVISLAQQVAEFSSDIFDRPIKDAGRVIKGYVERNKLCQVSQSE